MRPLLAVFALALALPATAAAGEFDELVLLRGDLSYEVLDRREDDQRGDGNLGWYKVITSAFGTYELRAEGPDGFSLTATVGGLLTAATDELGLFVQASGTSGPPHLELRVEDFWCENSLDWESCHAKLTGVVTTAEGTGERFAIEESTDGGVAELGPLLQELVLLELSALPSAAALMVSTVPEATDVLRYGWLTTSDGTTLHGVVAEDSSGGLCVVRDGVTTPVALEDLVGVDVRDIRLVGVQARDRWGVARFDDGRHIGGVVVERLSEGTWIRSMAGVYRLPAAGSAQVSEGRWTGAEPSCVESSASAAVGDWTPSPRDRGADSREWGGTTGELALVDRRGDPLESAEFDADRLYAVDSGYVGQRRWKRYRLSWQSFADRTGDPTVQLALDDYVEGQKRRVHTSRAVLVTGIGTAIASGVLLGVLSTNSLVNFNLLSDPGYQAVMAMAGGGIGTGVGFAIGGQIGLKVAGKKARGATRYQDLLEIITLEEAERAVERANEGGEGAARD